MRSFRRRVAVAWILLLTPVTPVLPGVSAAAVSSPGVIDTYTFPITQSGQTYGLEYCANGSALVADAAVTRVVVVIHGTSRTACNYAGYVASGAAASGEASSTLVVAPHFVTSSDIDSTSGNLYWGSSGWKEGDKSATSPYPRSWRLSSFEAVDALLASVSSSNRFPNLRSVVVAGHSAGGQFVNRYAAGARWRPEPGGRLTESFVVANPSSYMYWDSTRLISGRWRSLSKRERSACSAYDTYKYGLQSRNSFMNAWSVSALKANYVASEVKYLLGGDDNDPASADLDVSCAAQYQGPDRLARGQAYFSRLATVFGSGVTKTQNLVVVPGVDHSARDMFNSPDGLAALFGPPVLPGVSAAAVSSPGVIDTYTFPITQSGQTYGLEYCANGSALVADAAVTRVVVVIHGTSRTACNYAGYVASGAAASGEASSTLVVAPHFVTSSDIDSTSGNLYWGSSGWKEGDKSATSPYPRSWRLSSFEAVDALLASVSSSNRFPNLRSVVVAGHSAGGQFVNRYAAGARWRPEPGGRLTESFVVANPSSYMYWDSTRLISGRWRSLSKRERSACSAYDTYKYGLQSRNSFMNAWSVSALKANYVASEVKYLLGGDDNDPASADLDVSCAAQYQGPDRLARGQAYFSRLATVFGSGVTKTQNLVVVPGVDHSARDMFNSPDGLAALFG